MKEHFHDNYPYDILQFHKLIKLYFENIPSTKHILPPLVIKSTQTCIYKKPENQVACIQL